MGQILQYALRSGTCTKEVGSRLSPRLTCQGARSMQLRSGACTKEVGSGLSPRLTNWDCKSGAAREQEHGEKEHGDCTGSLKAREQVDWVSWEQAAALCFANGTCNVPEQSRRHAAKPAPLAFARHTTRYAV